MKYIISLATMLFFFAACNMQDTNKKEKINKEAITEQNAQSQLADIVQHLPEYGWKYPYQLPELPYDYDALVPVIDATTMETHHSKHHQGYTNKTNAAIEQNKLKQKPIVQLFTEIDQHPDNVRNNGGGFYNHSLFWTFITPGGNKFEGEAAQAIKKQFDSFEAFKKQFEAAAASQFGSGWAWLVMKPDGSLAITNSANQNNPLMPIAEVQGIPLLNIDVWEHAYYLSYKNKRTEYISNFWKIVNWNTVNKRYKMAKNIVQ